MGENLSPLGGRVEFTFDDIYIDVIDIEVNYWNPKVRSFLESKGYQFIKRIGGDEIYKNTKFKLKDLSVNG